MAGFSAVFVLLGASASAIGGFLAGFRIELFGLTIGAVEIAGLVIAVMGLHLLGVLRIPLLYRDTRFQVRSAPRGVLGTCAGRGRLRLRLVARAWARSWAASSPWPAARRPSFAGMGLLAVYAAGLAVPFLLAGLSVEWFFRSLAGVRRHVRRIEQVSGVLLVALGVLVATNRLTALNGYFAFLNRVVERAEAWLL